MVEKSFDITVKFERSRAGVWYPIVKSIFRLPNGDKLRLPLLLDTGADTVVLHPYYESMFDNLEPETFKGLGEKSRDGKKTRGKIEVFGREVECTIGFVEFELLSYRLGFLGRECLTSFGIGFWESARELYVTLTP